MYPVEPVFDAKPGWPGGPCIGPTSTQLAALFDVSTHKWPTLYSSNIIYPAPAEASRGKFAEESLCPIITIVPGFTPPIVEPIGNTIPPLAEEIGTVPRYIVPGAAYILFAYILSKGWANEPIFKLKSYAGIISWVTIPPKLPVGPV